MLSMHLQALDRDFSTLPKLPWEWGTTISLIFQMRKLRNADVQQINHSQSLMGFSIGLSPNGNPT